MPAAGLGTRWYPWSRVVPKELLPLGHYPAIHYVLEEAVAAGIREIGIVISESKQLIKAYVEDVWLINHHGVEIMWFYEHAQRGVGDALLCGREWVSERPTAILYPDIIHPKEGGMSQLFKAFQDHPTCWVGLTSKKRKYRQTSFVIERTDEKFFRISGLYIEGGAQRVGYGTGRSILAHGFSHMQGTFYHLEIQDGEEFDDDRILKPLWNQDEVRGIILREPIFDIGSPRNWCFAVSRSCDSVLDE